MTLAGPPWPSRNSRCDLPLASRSRITPQRDISIRLAASRHRCYSFVASRVLFGAMSRSDEPFCPPPWWCGGWWRAQGRIGPDGRSSRDGTGCPFTAAPSTTPAAGTPDRRQAGRSATSGCPLFGSFLWTSRERNPRRPQALIRKRGASRARNHCSAASSTIRASRRGDGS